MKPTIETELVNKANNRLAISAFLMVGTVAAAMTISKLTAPIAGAIFPFLLDGFITKLRLKKNDFYALEGLFSDTYKKTFRNWLKEHLDQSENITEKKYKMICLKFWMDHKKFKGLTVFDGGDDFLEDLSEELIAKGESKHRLFGIFYSESLTTTSKYKLPTASDFLLEDSKNNERLEIARKVYKEYSQLGLAGNAFMRSSKDLEALLILQNYRFHDEDLSNIKKICNNYKDVSSENAYIFGSNPCTEQSLMEKVINNEDDTSKLNQIKEAYLVGSTGKDFRENEFNAIIHHIDCKIQVVNLEKELNQAPTNGTNNSKRTKKI